MAKVKISSAMIEAGKREFLGYFEEDHRISRKQVVIRIFRAMVAEQVKETAVLTHAKVARQ